ncbi:hypothetical protein SAMN05421493_12434, partial [Pseudobutyrivibrio sp. 49]|uniref:hypothetical protein n=1 Tax=Pseudobutyrivibrio sp. 49 TaxID=1855344 RepID=UPI00088662D5
MKRSLAILLVAVLSITPITVSATENSSEDTPPVESSSPAEPEASPAAEEPIVEPSSEPEGGMARSLINGSSTTLDLEVTPSDGPDAGIEPKDPTEVEATSDGSEDEESTDEEESEETDELEVEETVEEHEHTFEYTSNNDGTHTITCSGRIHFSSDDGEADDVECDYEEVEECTFGEDGKCIYCGYEQEEEEEKFDPSISISFSNRSCHIGDTNPLICLNISQENYDIAYAQISLANYSKNKYINNALAQGKYYDYDEKEFVNIGGDGWYASPNITSDYAEGEYIVRSLYIRSTTGEEVHYSLESDTLPEEYQSSSIELLPAKSAIDKFKDYIVSSPADEDEDEEEDVEEEVVPTPTPKATPTPTPKPTPTPTPKATPTPT